MVREPRTMWTIHSWTCAFGKTVLVASGKPTSPSMEAISMSWTPRFFSSVTTPSQNLVPSASPTQRPRSFLSPFGLQPLLTRAVQGNCRGSGLSVCAFRSPCVP